jgi:hypothetical protein
MSIRRFEQQMGARESVEKNLNAHGYESPQEVIDSRNGTRDQIEDVLEGKDISSLLKFIGDERKKEDDKAIESFRGTSDSLEKLEVLRTLSLPDAIRCVKNNSYNEAQWRYLEGRLDFYQKFIQGKATRKQTEQEWDSNRGEYVNVVKEYQLDASNATPETIRTGILRDIEFAAMLGTPELGIYKVVEKRLKIKNSNQKHLLPSLKGSLSGIGVASGHWRSRYLYLNLENSDDQAQSERIGYGYTFLRKLYEESKALVVQRRKGEPIDGDALEHRAVIQAANWLEEAMNYNDPGRPLGSPYMGSIQESIAWARLGDPSVKKQLRGMRVKIQESDLRNIGRFIGKSGVNRYDAEHKRLYGQLKFLKEGYEEDKKQEFTARENNFAIQKQEQWLARETERLNLKFEKSRTKILQLDLPDEERQLQLQSLTDQLEETIAKMRADYDEQVAYFKGRTTEQLVSDLEQRQEVVNTRFEKRKSLAQKALDLHFKINHAGSDYGSKPLSGLVDWINYAPLGTIKRAHKMSSHGAGEDEITTYALADIIAGKRGATREDIRIIQGLVQKAKGQDHTARQKLEGMSKVGNIVSRFDYEVSLADVEDMATKGFHGMTEALKIYDLEQVKQFMDQGINLQSVTTVKKVTQKFGHDLSPVEIAAIAAHNIEGLEDAMRFFDLTAVKTLLSQDVSLPVAVAVLNNTRQFGYELTTQQIAKVAKNVRDINDFTEALRGLPLDEVEKLFAAGVSYQDFGIVKSALEKHRFASDFAAVLDIAQKLAKNNEYSNLDGALEFYSMQELDQVIASGAPLDGMLQIRKILEEKQLPTNLQETILFVKLCDRNYWNFAQCINTFGIENVRKMVTKSCRLDKALEVNNYINGESRRSRYGGESENEMPDSTREALRKGGIDVIIAIAKAGSIEAAVKTLAAGFTAEEVTRFPHLISSLVAKP